MMETRSKRQQTTQRPSYPKITAGPIISQSPSTSSASSSTYTSSSSLPSYSLSQSAESQYSMLQQQSYGSQAPLPSPLAQQASHSFGALAAAQTAAPGQAQAQIRTQQPQQVQQYVGTRGAEGGAPETAPFLNNFNLVAEAAKRAQMACLMRDLGDVEL